jgi:uncharacterized protein
LGCLVAAVTSFATLLFIVICFEENFEHAFEQEALPHDAGVLGFALLTMGLSCWAAAIAGTVVQGRRIDVLVTPLFKFRWRLFCKVLLLALVLSGIAIAVQVAVAPSVQFNRPTSAWLVWAVPVLFACLIQTSGEEVLFKGYLFRQLGAVVPWAAAAALLTASFFALLHVGNADVQERPALFVMLLAVTEMVALYLFIRSGGMEIPIALHFVNNTVVFMFFAEQGTQANELTLWVHERPLDERRELWWDIFEASMMVIGYIVLLAALLWHRSPFFMGPPLHPSEQRTPAAQPVPSG